MTSRLFELVFLLFIIYFSVREIRKIIKQRKAYFTGFFNLIEVILMPLYLLMFVLIIGRWLTTAANIKSFKENPKDFVSFQYSAAADQTLQAVIGIVCFLLNIKFLRMFQFAKVFFTVGVIMKGFAYPVAMFMIPFSIYFFLFAWVAHLGFGANSEHYQSIIRTIVTQFLHMLGTTDFEHITEVSPIFGPLYFAAFTLYMLFIVFNVLMAIICEAIDGDYEEEFVKQAGDIQMIEYMTRRFKEIVGITEEDAPRFIEADGEDLEEPAELKYQKMDERMTQFEESIDQLFGYVNNLKIVEEEEEEEEETELAACEPEDDEKPPQLIKQDSNCEEEDTKDSARVDDVNDSKLSLIQL